ncbi:MAG: M20 family metallopeptidase [Ruminococcaceae bacterium]|nr:M20 family metallopeptidase [Oscillospiraceae bacterium]
MIRKYFEEHKSEIIACIKRLVEIPSVKEDGAENAPFGKHCAEALAAVKEMYEDSGFETELYKNEGYLLSYYRGGDKKRIGLFSHSDIVPGGDGWIYTEPYKLLQKDGFLFGRGVEDNISGIMVSLFATRAIRDLNLPFDSTLVLFTGSNEESGMEDIKAYAKNHTCPDLSLVPDAEFPACRGEAGICHIWAESPKCTNHLENFSGGSAFNVILGKARAVLKYDEKIFESLLSKAPGEVEIKCENDKIIIDATGISKHVCAPEGSQNAGYFIFNLLSSCEYIEKSERNIFESAARLLKTPFGDGMGIENADDDFGRMSCGNGMIKFEEGRLKLSFDIRYGSLYSAEDIETCVFNALDKIGWEMKLDSNSEGYLFSASDEFVAAMEEAYNRCTGDSDARAFAIKGGTYARNIKNAIPVGSVCIRECPFDLPDGHGGIHQADECISIQGLIDAMVIITEMIISCDKL